MITDPVGDYDMQLLVEICWLRLETAYYDYKLLTMN